MAIMGVRSSFRATHGSRVLYNDLFIVELIYRAPVVEGFVGGIDYNAPKERLRALTDALNGSYLNDIIGRATKEALAEYVGRRKRRKILDLFGKLDWPDDYDYKALRNKP